MNSSQIHLALNHIPVLLSITGALILFYGLLRKNNSIINISLSLLVISALFTVPVYLTGEGTEETVEHTAGVSENLIGQHEDMATISFILIGLAGFIALISLFFRNKNVVAKRMAVATLIFSFIAFGAMARTAHLGGMIRHTQLQSGATVNAEGNENDQQDKEEKTNQKKKDDDD